MAGAELTDEVEARLLRVCVLAPRRCLFLACANSSEREVSGPPGDE